MTTNEAAALIGCTQSHVRTLIRTGRLPARRRYREFGYTLDVDPGDAAEYRDRPMDGRGFPRGRSRKKPIR